MRANNESKVSILVLENDEISRSTISRLVEFKLPDIALYSADNCRDGFKLCKTHKIDMIITTIENRRVQYRRMFDHVRKVNRHAKLLLITTAREIKSTRYDPEIPDISLIQMPVDFRELVHEAMASVGKIEEERTRDPIVGTK